MKRFRKFVFALLLISAGVWFWRAPILGAFISFILARSDAPPVEFTVTEVGTDSISFDHINAPALGISLIAPRLTTKDLLNGEREILLSAGRLSLTSPAETTEAKRSGGLNLTTLREFPATLPQGKFTIAPLKFTATTCGEVRDGEISGEIIRRQAAFDGRVELAYAGHSTKLTLKSDSISVVNRLYFDNKEIAAILSPPGRLKAELTPAFLNALPLPGCSNFSGGGLTADLEFKPAAADQLIFNGTFKAGNSGFTGSYNGESTVSFASQPFVTFATGGILSASAKNFLIEGKLSSPLTVRYSSDPRGFTLDGRVFTVRKVENGLSLEASIKEASVSVPFPITKLDLTANYKQAGDRRVISIKQFKGELLGGTADVTPGEYLLSEDQCRPFVINAARIDISEILALYATSKVEGTGRLSGRIPLAVCSSGIRIENGALQSEQGGNIKIKAGEAKSGDDTANFALQALQDFDYSSLSAELSMAENGDLTIALKFNGISRSLNKPTPVVVNLKLEENLWALSKSLRVAQDITKEAAGRYEQERFEREQGNPQ